MPTIKYSSVDQAADEIIRRTQGHIVVGMPLGLGKPNQLINALYRKVAANLDFSLTIYTALSLSRPHIADKSELEQRFLKPFIEKVFGNYVELEYLYAMRRGELPSNVKVHEFFVQPGSELNNAYAQQHYMSSNYTHAARDINAHSINVIAQLIAEEQGRISFGCNPEVTLDLLPLLQQRKQQGETVIAVGQIHRDLPFMENSAVVPADTLDIVIDDPKTHTTLMSTPNMPVSMVEHFIGLNASALVRDGGTLQVGIGALGDAVTAALLLRQHDNMVYQSLLGESLLTQRFGETIKTLGGTQGFDEGLYGCSEMLTYGLFRLFCEGIIKREVSDTRYDSHPAICLHGGFFLGPKAFYDELKNLSPVQRKKIDMTNISFVNHLYGNEALKRSHRKDARFINTAFTVTLMGAVTSDQLDDGRVLSGVGGQYNFVAQAHELEGACSIILVRATRATAKGVQSNIVWNYGHTTVPRHLRDIVITEYGIADLRGKSDSEVIAAMLNITDSRFQYELLEEAKFMKKIPADYVIPEVHRQNLPERLDAIYRRRREKGCFAEFPLGCDFTETERQLLKALGWLKSNIKPENIFTLLKHVSFADENYHIYLERMNLARPKTIKEKLYRLLLITGLRAML